MMSEIEYINILPDMERMDHDMDDSSFLKGSFADKSGTGKFHKRVESLDTNNFNEGAANNLGRGAQLVESQQV